MANWNLPTVDSNYITFVDEVKNRDIDNARMFDGTPAATNIPTLTIRWNQSNNRFERWSGTVWEGRTIGITGGGTGATTAAGARSNLNLGSMATQNSNAVGVTGGSITGVSFTSNNVNITGGNAFGITGKTSSRTSTSTTLALEAAAMNAHRTSSDHDNRYAPANTVARNKGSISGGTYLERKDGTIPQFFFHSTAGAPSDSPTSSQASVLLMSNTWGDPMISIPNSGDGFYWRNGNSSVWRNAANASNLTSGTVDAARLNILGTVSTVGGVPSGSIVERSSNANGEYVKFADGTMICTRMLTGTTTTSSGSIFVSSSYSTWTFPVAFVGLFPSVLGTVNGGGRWVLTQSLSLTSVGVAQASPISSATSLGAYLTAVGRWY